MVVVLFSLSAECKKGSESILFYNEPIKFCTVRFTNRSFTCSLSQCIVYTALSNFCPIWQLTTYNSTYMFIRFIHTWIEKISPKLTVVFNLCFLFILQVLVFNDSKNVNPYFLYRFNIPYNIFFILSLKSVEKLFLRKWWHATKKV